MQISELSGQFVQTIVRTESLISTCVIATFMDSRRECPLAGIPTGGNAHGRECPPLISLEVGIRGSGYSRFCRSGIPTRCHWPHPSRRYPAPLQYQAKSAQAESRLPQIIIPLIHKM